MKKLLVVLSVLLMMAGCGKKDEFKTTVCEGDYEGVHVVQTLTHDDTKVYTQVMCMTSDVAELFDEEFDVEAALQMMMELYDKEGVTYTYSLDGTILTETIELDYEKADMAVLREAMLVEGDETTSYVGYEETMKNMEAAGLACKLK